MDVDFTPEQRSLVQEAIQSGRIRSQEDAAEEAFSLWAERERRRSEILTAVDESRASIAQGKGRRVATAEESRQLAQDIGERGMARLAAKAPAMR